jgi:hypothetical protein
MSDDLERDRPAPSAGGAEDILQLTELYCQGRLSDREKHRFEQLLNDSEQARLQYLSYMSIHARLMELNRPVGRPMGVIPLDEGRGVAGLPAFFQRVPVSAVAAIGLLCIGLIGGSAWYIAKSRDGNLAGRVAPGQLPLVADVTQTLGVVTGPQSAKLESQLRVGQSIVLEAGLVELQLNTGPTLLLEGPASFQLAADGSANLASGKLFIDTKGAELLITTPNVRMLNIGTRYGLNAAADRLGVHVFEGSVELEGITDDSLSAQLTEGNAVEIVRRDGRLVSRSIEAQPDAFVQSFGDLAGYYRWLVKRDVFANDPDLVCYYSFDEKSTADGRVVNHAASTGSALDLVVPSTTGNQGPYWVDGRWWQKRAIEFTGDDQPVLLPADPRLAINGDLTVMWWMNAKQIQIREVHIVVVSRGADGESSAANFPYSFGFSSGAYWALHESGNGTDHTFCPVALVDHSRWAHVAFVRDAVNKTYTIYADGKIVTQAPYETNPDGGDSPEVRTALAQAGTKRTELFQGAVDEVMIFRRALSADEVLKIYENGRP